MGKRCDEGKKPYPSEAEASVALAKWVEGVQKRQNKKGKPIPVRVYVCPFCGFWHITSQPERVRNAAWHGIADGLR
jgi:rubrerythrin